MTLNEFLDQPLPQLRPPPPRLSALHRDGQRFSLSNQHDEIDGVRGQLPSVRHFVALEGSRDNWINYESALASHSPDFRKVGYRRNRSPDHQLYKRNDGAPERSDDYPPQKPRT